MGRQVTGALCCVQFVGVQVDVTSKTEGTSVGDKSGVPLLVKYDTRLRESGKNAVNEINQTVQVTVLSLSNNLGWKP